jgi:hypothetical protein
MRSGCERFIGLKYRLGGDGSDGTIDCINLTLQVLGELEIPHPEMNPGWYEASRWRVMRDICRWGKRIKTPAYDGDVVLIPHQNWAFGVTWQHGILLASEATGRVSWHPLSQVPSPYAFRYCPSRSS